MSGIVSPLLGRTRLRCRTVVPVVTLVPHLRQVALLAVLAAACTSTVLPPESRFVGTLEERLARLGVSTDEIVDPAALSAEMIDWVHQQVPKVGTRADMARSLLSAVVEERGLDLQYNDSFTGTASEVFASREANCLAFTHLVVGLGRELGLHVYYLGFRQQPRYEREGSLVVVWEHVTAGFGPPEDRLILQLPVGPQVEFEKARSISDETGLAMHYSNRGAELVRQEQIQEAKEMLEIAVAIDPNWSHGWVNLGVALRRSGDLEAAELAYRRALETDPDHEQAYHNLAALLWLRDEHDAASEILELLDRRDNRNPFVYLSLGDMSRRAQRFDEARRYYKRASRLAPGSAEPRAALGQLALREGERKRAEGFLRQAEKRAADDERTRRLRQALESSVAPGG